MCSSSPAWARPVRTFARSAFSVSTVFLIFCSAFFLTSAIIAASRPSRANQSIVEKCPFVLAQHDALQRGRLKDAEDVDGELLVAAQRQRGGIHHLQVLEDGLVEGE